MIEICAVCGEQLVVELTKEISGAPGYKVVHLWERPNESDAMVTDCFCPHCSIRYRHPELEKMG